MNRRDAETQRRKEEKCEERREEFKACHVKCDACPVKFEARKYFTREGAYFTVV